MARAIHRGWRNSVSSRQRAAGAAPEHTPSDRSALPPLIQPIENGLFAGDVLGPAMPAVPVGNPVGSPGTPPGMETGTNAIIILCKNTKRLPVLPPGRDGL